MVLANGTHGRYHKVPVDVNVAAAAVTTRIRQGQLANVRKSDPAGSGRDGDDPPIVWPWMSCLVGHPFRSTVRIA
jgi:hypothetical protein